MGKYYISKHSIINYLATDKAFGNTQKSEWHEGIILKFRLRSKFMYQFKELYTLDFSKVNYINEVHQIIKDELDFPDHYGMNWSAFWDCLTDMVGDPIHIEIVGMETVQRKFPRHAQIMLETLKDLKHLDNDDYKNQIRIEIVIGEARYEIS